jgi:hypothetical protein
MTTPRPLPEGSVLLHIGPQKTGSTAIQMAMHQSREMLAAHGVRYTGRTHTPREAGWAVLGSSAIGRPVPRDKAWRKLVDEIRAATEPRVVVSNEDFALADDAAAARIVEGTDAARTHLIFVARRIDKLLPSHWQERVKARMTLSYPEFLTHVTRDGANDWESRMMWEPQDVTALVDRWAQHLDRDRISVLIADEDDRGLIPRTFEELLALPTGSLVPPKSRSNSSLSFPATEALRRVNRLTKDEAWTPQQYWRIVQSGIVERLKERSDDGQPRLTGVPASSFEEVADRADQQIEAILTAGVHVIGDPERLRIRGRVTPVEPPTEVETVSLALLTDVVSGAVAGSERLHQTELKRALRQVRPAPTADALSGRELAGLLRSRVGRRLRAARGGR